ncbi:DNA repair protein RecO [Mesomycoplasma lagogenitalium]|uniref:DNA repair protein RecO n=1 Tax=Mesomycoplasma lagogenitalium TaxID=171286 RepID=A0ABY8LWN7_9BACT|nr:DNA repair protein RecO [Mesomycoplasma lagogenitalium]WGI36537.1 DNA repair protein RecO [Mesomycoplasma lagogenitalium]
MSSKIIKGIVIANNDFNDHDAIVKIITNKKIISFVALGVRKPNSKNRPSLLVWTLGEYEIFLSRLNNKLSKLKKGTIIKTIDHLQMTSFLSEMQEILYYLNKLEISNHQLFTNLNDFISLANGENIYYCKTFLLFKITENFGFKQNLRSCVECNSNQNLRDFQLYSGGFLCKFHSKDNIFRSIEELKTFYYLNYSMSDYIKLANSYANLIIYREIINFLKENIA